MKLVSELQSTLPGLRTLRQDIHANPEASFEETRTSALVAKRLRAAGIETHEGIGGTGVVGVLRGSLPDNGKCIGLRADMDALRMTESTGLGYASRRPGVFHGCGHDGHTTMLIGAAEYLARTRHFSGTVVFIFQLAEEAIAGAKAMIDDGLFERFACSEVYAVHNAPHLKPGQIAVKAGVMLAAGDLLFAANVARDIVSPANVLSDFPAIMASEDFAVMLQHRPGAYLLQGQDGVECHNPQFDFNDDILPIGISLFVRLVERRLADATGHDTEDY
jgi:metal-dependent amidase/aminoacylase/carboxypeptidase family protein